MPLDERLAARALIRDRTRSAATARFAARSSGDRPAAHPDRRPPRVALYSRSLEDVRETVAFVRDRVLLAARRARS